MVIKYDYTHKYAIQGVEGAFSYEALLGYETNLQKEDYICVDSFDEVFESVVSGRAQYGVLPIENSSTGGISAVYDLFSSNDVYIVAEIYQKVTHHLLSAHPVSVSEIENVYSHIQAFEQSKSFFRKNPNLNFVPYKNTAMSAEMISVSKSPKDAAIASSLAAERYGLYIVEENINDQKNNYTRFIVISSRNIAEGHPNKISIKSVVDHTPGSLFRMLKCFETEQINLTKIESRPIKGKSWEYAFYIDFEGNLEEEKFERAIAHIKLNSREFKILGNYPMGEYK